MKCLKAAFRYQLFENKNHANGMVSTYILLPQITERCHVFIYTLCLVPKIALYSECGEWSVTLKQQTLHLKQINKSQWVCLLMFLTTSCISSGKPPVPRATPSHLDQLPLGRRRPVVQLGKWSPSIVKNIHSGSDSPGGTPSVGPVTRRGSKTCENGFHKQLFNWDGKRGYINLTPFYIKQQHPCAICWQKDAIGVPRGVQWGPVPEARNI